MGALNILTQYDLQTGAEGYTEITQTVQAALAKSGVQDGLCVVYCPHTTAGITINENADPGVVCNMLLGLSRAYPPSPEFRHAEGNSPAHLKASAIGTSVTVIVQNGRLVLGTWQGIYFCEIDRPRSRRFM